MMDFSTYNTIRTINDRPNLVQYFRNKRNDKIGCMFAYETSSIAGSEPAINNLVTIGYSLCNKNDKFDKRKALHIATARAVKYDVTRRKQVIPQSMHIDLMKFAERCERYFKCKNTSLDSYDISGSEAKDDVK